MPVLDIKTVKMKKSPAPSRRSQQEDAHGTLSARKDSCSEVFDGSWPDSDTINFVKNGLIERGW